jgi:hypothetical protein
MSEISSSGVSSGGNSNLCHGRSSSRFGLRARFAALPAPPVVALSAPVSSPVFVTSQVPGSFVGLRSSGCLHAVCPSFGELSCCVLTRWNEVQIMYRLVRKSSFLPAHRNVVPEEMWPGDGADEFLLDMIERVWANGKGLDMDIME